MRHLSTKTILISILGVAGLAGCDGDLFGDCADTVKAEAPSPGGGYVATVFERDCGATTDFSTHVSIREADEPFDSSTKTRVLIVAGQTEVDIEWSTEKKLSVTFSPAETFTKLETWRDVRIVYK